MGYKIIKPEGNNANVSLVNTTTDASLIIGKVTYELLSIIEKEIDFEELHLSYRDYWDLKITDTLAGNFMSDPHIFKTKPISKDVKAKPKTKEEAKTEHNKNVNAWDVLFGTAMYE